MSARYKKFDMVRRMYQEWISGPLSCVRVDTFGALTVFSIGIVGQLYSS